MPDFDPNTRWSALDNYFVPLEEDQHYPESYLQVWEEAQDAIKHHIYRGKGYQHPHYVQADLQTGATRAFWIDSLSAFYPGVLTLAGKIEEATEIHLLATALWTRFAGLPERWNVVTGNIDNGLGWWGGRPEFIESTYYLFRATRDPWYLHVGEMVLRDIKRRCWTRCGLAGLQNVLTGELQDRMESFFLGETAKYLFLLFDSDHPLNNMDAAFVFTTEGHPLIIPTYSATGKKTPQPADDGVDGGVCEIAPHLPPLGSSSTAARPDIFHAASLARLHLMHTRDEAGGALLEFAHDHPSVTVSDLFSPSNYTFYPWTLPPELVPYNATSAPMSIRPTLDISFPSLPGMTLGPGTVERVRDGIFLKAIGGMRLGMVQDKPIRSDDNVTPSEGFRIQVINNVPLGKDEKVYLSREIAFGVLDSDDPNFARVQDPVMLDIVIDVEPENYTMPTTPEEEQITMAHRQEPIIHQHTRSMVGPDDALVTAVPRASSVKTALSALLSHVSSIISDESTDTKRRSGKKKKKNSYRFLQEQQDEQEEEPLDNSVVRMTIPAVNSIGLGSASLPDVPDAVVFSYTGRRSTERLRWSKVYFADELCDEPLPLTVPRTHHVLVVKRGGCSFSEKMRRIPAYPYSKNSGLQLVILVSYQEHDEETMSATSSSSSSDQLLSTNNIRAALNRPFTSTDPALIQPKAAILSESFLVRPHLDATQHTAGGFVRRHPISMVMVGGGEETYNLLRDSMGLGIRRRYGIQSQGVPIANLHMV